MAQRCHARYAALEKVVAALHPWIHRSHLRAIGDIPPRRTAAQERIRDSQIRAVKRVEKLVAGVDELAVGIHAEIPSTHHRLSARYLRKADFVKYLSPAIPAVCAFRPNIAHIMIGSNDIKRSADHFDHPHLSLSEYRRTLRYIIKVIMERGTDVLISTIPPLCIAKSTPAFAADNVVFHEEDRRACNDAIRALADEEGCFLNDMEALYAQYPTDALTEDDGLHLNANGQFLLAQAIFKRLASIAAKRT